MLKSDFLNINMMKFFRIVTIFLFCISISEITHAQTEGNIEADTVAITLPTDTSVRYTVKKRREYVPTTTQKSNVVTPEDSTKTKVIKPHNPTTALLLSIAPGGGQIYNRKWWKLPIIYAGLGTSGYFIVTNAQKSIQFRNELFFRQYNDKEALDPNLEQYPIENIIGMRNQYRRNMEIAIGAFTIIYMLNLVDAFVDAHLYDFDISDDLSMKIYPTLNNNLPYTTLTPCLTLRINF